MNPRTGKTFMRTVKSLAIGRGDAAGAEAYAQSQGHWLDQADVIKSIQMGAVTGVGTSDYALPTPAEFDFAEFVRGQMIIGKLPLRHQPARTRVIAATAGSTSYWSGERNPRPISRLTLAGSTLDALSVISVVVTSAELLSSSSPQAETILARDLSAAAVQAMDQAFIDPSNAGSAGVKPAAITNGVTAIHSSGSTLAQIDSDLALLIQALSDAGSDLTAATWVLRPRTALYLSLLRGSGGALAYPLMTVKGGTLAGLPAIVSSSVPSSVGSPAEGGNITLLDPSQIELVDDGNSAIEVSKQGSLQMEDSPGSGAQSLVSLWQTESAAIKLTRYANWQRCRAGMAQVLDQVTY